MLSSPATERFYCLALCVTAFILPFPFIFAPIAIAVLSVAWLANFDLRRIATSLKEGKTIWLWVVFYLLHIATYFYTADKAITRSDLETKLSFVVLPFLVGTGPVIDKAKLENIFFFFIKGLFFMAVYFFARALIVWSQTNDKEIFFYHNLIQGTGANAVYYALYTFLGLTALLLFKWNNILALSKPVYYSYFFTLFAFLVLLSSRSLLVLFCLLPLPIYLLRQLKIKRITGYLFAAFGVLTVSLILLTKNPIRERYRDVLQNTNKTEWLPQHSGGQEQHFNNLTLRLFLWKTAIDNIRDNNLWWRGCGNGSIEMLQRQKISGYANSSQLLALNPPLWKYNIHNMYLQELMMLGLPGLLIFVVLVFLPLFATSKKEDNTVFVLFNVAAAFFMLQESALQTQAGVVFYLFFYMVFYNFIVSGKAGSATGTGHEMLPTGGAPAAAQTQTHRI